MTGVLSSVDRYVLTTSPFTPVLGAARSLLALATLLTIVATDASSLFFRSVSHPDGVTCDTVVSAIGIFCTSASVEQGVPAWAVAVAALVLLAVASGVAPRLLAVPHWYVTWSLASASPIPDGGDHLASVLTLLLVPLGLLDRRRWHWATDTGYERRAPLVKFAAYGVVVLWVVQLFGVYFQASVAKMAVPEWSDGSALWYWMQNPTFGPPEPLSTGVLWALAHPVVVVALTYGTLVFQLALAVAPCFTRNARAVMLAAAVAFHGGIALAMGLWSFSLVMIAADLVFLIRPHEAQRWHDLLFLHRFASPRARRRPDSAAAVGAAPDHTLDDGGLT